MNKISRSEIFHVKNVNSVFAWILEVCEGQVVGTCGKNKLSRMGGSSDGPLL